MYESALLLVLCSNSCIGQLRMQEHRLTEILSYCWKKKRKRREYKLKEREIVKRGKEQELTLRRLENSQL